MSIKALITAITLGSASLAAVTPALAAPPPRAEQRIEHREVREAREGRFERRELRADHRFERRELRRDGRFERGRSERGGHGGYRR